jgi:hypothetical protein
MMIAAFTAGATGQAHQCDTAAEMCAWLRGFVIACRQARTNTERRHAREMAEAKQREAAAGRTVGEA